MACSLTRAWSRFFFPGILPCTDFFHWLVGSEFLQLQYKYTVFASSRQARKITIQKEWQWLNWTGFYASINRVKPVTPLFAAFQDYLCHPALKKNPCIVFQGFSGLPIPVQQQKQNVSPVTSNVWEKGMLKSTKNQHYHGHWRNQNVVQEDDLERWEVDFSDIITNYTSASLVLESGLCNSES